MLLLDDIFTPRNDRVLAVFNSHRNIEVRLFNPASRASPAAWSFLWDFSRANSSSIGVELTGEPVAEDDASV